MARDRSRLSGVDLNLLVALDALLHEASVTRAGRRIGLSQPAMSHALSKLRELLGDPLLVRAGGAMRPTELGQRIAPSVRRTIAEIEATLLGQREFDPSRGTRTFRIATNDYCGAVLLPSIASHVRRVAPRVVIEVHALAGQAPVQELARGELDVALGTLLALPVGLRSVELFRERFVCLLRKGHPAGRRKLDLHTFAALDHVLVSSPGYGPGVVDHMLARAGLERRVAFRVPHFLVAPALLTGTDLVLTLPERLARQAARAYSLRVHRPPIELDAFGVSLVWHQRWEADGAHAWLRRALLDAIESAVGHSRRE